MSATGRNKPGKERDPLDYYPTPAATTRAILPFLGITRHDYVFDPACGDGAILNEVRTWYGCKTEGIEIDPTRAAIAREHGSAVRTGDALASEWMAESQTEWMAESSALPQETRRGCRWLIGNPPFGLEMSFVATSIKELANLRLDRVVWLLKLDFVASEERRAFHRRHPSDLYVVKRPSFTGDGDTDAQNYAWFVWPGEGRWRVL